MMAVSVVAYAAGDDLNSGSAHTVSFNAGAVGDDGCLYIAIRGIIGYDISAVAYNGVSATYVGATAGGFELWRLIDPVASTAADVTWTVGSGGSRCSHAFISLSGVDQTTPENAVEYTSQTSSATRQTGTITCPSGGLVLGFLHVGYSGSGVSGTGLLASDNTGSRVIAVSSRDSTGALSWTTEVVSDLWGTIGVPVRAASTGDTTAFNKHRTLIGVG